MYNKYVKILYTFDVFCVFRKNHILYAGLPFAKIKLIFCKVFFFHIKLFERGGIFSCIHIIQNRYEIVISGNIYIGTNIRRYTHYNIHIYVYITHNKCIMCVFYFN